MELTTEDEKLAQALILTYQSRMTVFALGRTWYIEEYNKTTIYLPVEYTFVLQAA